MRNNRKEGKKGKREEGGGEKGRKERRGENQKRKVRARKGREKEGGVGKEGVRARAEREREKGEERGSLQISLLLIIPVRGGSMGRKQGSVLEVKVTITWRFYFN